MKNAEIVNKPFSATVGDGACETLGDVFFSDSVDSEVVERCHEWQRLHAAKNAPKAKSGFNTLALALRKKGIR